VNDHAHVLIQNQAHRHGVHVVDVPSGAIVELLDQMLDAVQANQVEVFRRIGHRGIPVRTRVAQDSSQLRQALRGIVHRA
jgi:hypothetical protein